MTRAGMRGARLVDRAVALALLAYPRAFRQRFGDELRQDALRALHTTGTAGTVRHLTMLVVSGLGERGTVLGRFLLAPQARSPMYESLGGRPALWDAPAWDLRQALRQARRTPAVTGMAVFALALGIGATTAVYSAIDAALLRPLPFPHSQALVRLSDVYVPVDYSDLQPAGKDDTPRMVVRASRLEVTHLAEMRDVFSHTAVMASGGLNLGAGPEPVRIDVTFVTGEFFRMFGRTALHGRVLTPEDASLGRPVTVLSHRLWRSHFARDQAAVGTTVLLNDVPHEVVGIMPEDASVPASAQGDARLFRHHGHAPAAWT